ncbi:MAG: chorismate mutase [bacterium]|nr:chorismate mutase [bacterium]
MSKLDEARIKINDIDKKMAELFESRMEASKSIAEYKKENGLSIEDSKREVELISKNSEYIKNDEIKEYYVSFIKEILNESKKYQARLIKGLKVAYTGVPGAFAYIAAKRMYPTASFHAFPDFGKAYNSVLNGTCDVVVLPIENSTAGDVGNVIDLIFEGNLYINQVLSVDIQQNLLAVKGANKDSIKTVYSHPQALAQSSEFIKEHSYDEIECVNTAVAAKMVSEKNDTSIAAIASLETANLYNLEIIEKNINQNKNNSTRFACFSRSLNKNINSKGDTNFILVFTVSNEAGSLAKALNIISSNGFNMRNLRSRPMKNSMWKYYFYVEIEGNVFSETGSDLLVQLKTVCDDLKLVGTYRVD